MILNAYQLISQMDLDTHNTNGLHGVLDDAISTDQDYELIDKALITVFDNSQVSLRPFAY